MALAPGTRLGLYEIVAPLGAGGMGEVYRARDSRLRREVALKVLPERMRNDALALERFRREAQLLAGLNHPHIAAVYGFEDGALAMELVEGETLADRLRRGAMPVAEALAVARQLAEALEYAHERGIIHRDLKPANIKLTPDDKVKVLDFGLAKALSPELSGSDFEDAPTLTTPATLAGTILGTAAYMAPEQARGKAVDRRADIWAFGVVWYEMLTGARAFAGETTSDVLAGVLRAEPDWTKLPLDLAAEQQRLLLRCLRKDPRQRQQSMGDVRVALEEAPEAAAAAAAAAPPVSPAGVLAFRRGTLATSQLEIVDRAGKVLHAVGAPGEFTEAQLSPDGKRIALGLPDETAGDSSLWLMDVASGSRTRFTFDKANHIGPIWSPDGRWIYYEANRTGSYEMSRKLADGSGEPEYVYKGGNYLTADSVSHDGRVLTFSDTGNTTSTDLWWIPVNPEAQGKPGAAAAYLRTPAREIYSALSPDGKLMAYQSDANGGGDWEVFVGDFPRHASQWQVSSGGGYWPKWSADGRELYFYAGGNLMVATVTPGPTPQFGPARALFALHPPESLTESSPDYTPLPDGKGFMIDQLLGGDTRAPIEIMSRWRTAIQH